MHPDYSDWLRRAVPTEATWSTKLSELRRVEAQYGEIDTLYDADELTSLIDELTYSREMERRDEPNPSKLPINGNLRNNLASYKSAVAKYARFRADLELEAVQPHARDLSEANAQTASARDLCFRYEQDLQTALVSCVEQIEPGLHLFENGKEYAVPSGRIDVLAVDARGNRVVIELKATTAGHDVLGQIAAYMADIEDETGARPRGVLIAPDFDPKLIRAARMIEGLVLMKYSFAFSFSRVG
ncbi:hypothetical protein BYZ73_03745 [Rhodovulum viride]|uniref:Endonuclease NucS C-terminal domain-containing protein n=1 Tax=Rhodovulum viride TaxID=1231134 RepID=A0ABX9DNF6_9RHOB|nr:endonuclease NucS domain-containing protein [Rhodovulum viride]RAP42787.1 hypothetical protein BYZ73_03745 [Rhodovulum viride]